MIRSEPTHEWQSLSGEERGKMGKLTGAEIVVKALEDEGIPFAFGIPGAQNLDSMMFLATVGRSTDRRNRTNNARPSWPMGLGAQAVNSAV